MFSFAEAQTTPFEITLEAVTITDLGGIQSYAWGQHEGKWLIVGGRLDGLHRRQPFAAFDAAGNNTQLIVVDPVSGEKWAAPLTSLPVSVREQLSSTNMQFFQNGDYLYCTGGYGISATAGGHTTYDKFTAITVSEVIQAIVSGAPFAAFIRQITDEQFQITGGHLEKINDTYYLLGGQKFIGSYNPMGPTHGPGFFQEYTNAVRRFTLIDDGTTLNITHLAPYQDSVNLHRRDYNAEPQILPNGQEGITMFSGVFQYGANLPFLNSVTVDATGYTVNNSFSQYYNHYHCPVIPIYSSANNEMHNVFFGGIAQFYDDGGTLVQDDEVPFVKTIARVTRGANGTMTETKLPIEMPTLLGAGAEFIVNRDIAQYRNGVLMLDSLSTDNTHIGYIYGGISSSAPNIFFSNTGTQSSASGQLFKVFLKKSASSGTRENVGPSTGSLELKLYPNPVRKELHISFVLAKAEKVVFQLSNESGAILEEEVLEDLVQGANMYTKDISGLQTSGTYLISMQTEAGIETKKLIIKR